MSIQTAPVLDQLKHVGLLRPLRTRGAYRTASKQAMVSAQTILAQQGFVLASVKMIQGSFYELRYNNSGPFDEWPYWVVLQFDTEDCSQSVPLGLFYYERSDDEESSKLSRWGLGYTFGTETSEAEKMVVDFKRNHAFPVEPFWVPVFDA